MCHFSNPPLLVLMFEVKYFSCFYWIVLNTLENHFLNGMQFFKKSLPFSSHREQNTHIDKKVKNIWTL